MQRQNASRFEWLCLAFVITFAFHRLPLWAAALSWPYMTESWQRIGFSNFYDLSTLLFACLLVMSCPMRSGLCVGEIRANLWRTLLVCTVPVAVTAIVYPFLPEQPFSGGPIGTWLISPLAQDMVFVGYLYGRFEMVFPSYVHRRVHIRWALVITALFFSAWHLPNFQWLDASFVVFQLCYTFVGCILTGLSRQWTGSIFYVTITHMAANFITWL